jgi:hypothetical protein
VFGSGRACRNSCDFRTAVIPDTRRGAGRPAQPTRDLRHSPPGHPRLYRSRQAPAIAPVACSRRMPLSHHGHRGRATASPALYHAPPQTPPFSHIIPYPPPPTRPRPPPRSRRRTPMERHEPRVHCVPTPWIPGFTASCALRPAYSVLRPARGVRQQAAPPPAPRNPPARTRVPTERTPNPNANRTQPLIRGKPFLTASNTPADYAELPTARPSPERIEGVSRSLPFSDLLALTSSHMFFSVMN